MSDTQPVNGRPIMLATQLVKAIRIDSPEAKEIFEEDPLVLLDGLTHLSVHLAQLVAAQTGSSVSDVLDSVQNTTLKAVRQGVATS
ncbi:hypothetical protein LG293_16475 (plasmid) [Citricoccus nitrophenolicus]